MSLAVTAFDYVATEKVLVPSCPVCETPNPACLTIDRYGYQIGVSACSCGLVYINPRMSIEAYQDFYTQAYRDLVSKTNGGASESDAHGFARGRMIGLLLKHSGSPGGRLFDVGGGIGIVAAGIADVVPVSTTTILDPNEQELLQAHTRGYQTIQGMIETQPVPVNGADLICCALTADHWVEPLRALRRLREILAPQGRLYVDIIDASEYRKYHPVNYFKLDHPLYWVPQSFTQALWRTGWKIMITAYTGQRRMGWDKCRIGYICQGV